MVITSYFEYCRKKKVMNFFFDKSGTQLLKHYEGTWTHCMNQFLKWLEENNYKPLSIGFSIIEYQKV